MQRWPSPELLQAHADSIRSSVRLTDIVEEIAGLERAPAPAADADPQLARGIRRLARRALSAGILSAG